MKTTVDYLPLYAARRPLFLSVLRAKEAALYQPYLPLKRPVLDVGCGDGFFARTAFGKNKIDIGLDMQESRIEEARSSGAYRSIVTYDGYTIPLKNRSVGTVVVNSVLEHVENLPQMLSEIRRVLVPGGVCYATVMAAPWEQNLLGAVFFGDMYRRWMREKQVHRNLLDYQGWRHAFVRAKLTVQEVDAYVSKRGARMLDFLHYVSLPSLMSYTINRKWVWWPRLTRFYPMRFLASVMEDEVSREHAGALCWKLVRK